MPLLALIAIFVLVPLAELYVIIKVVGPALGAPLTIALLAADSLAGAWLMKSQGRTVWRRFNETIGAGRQLSLRLSDPAIDAAPDGLDAPSPDSVSPRA